MITDHHNLTVAQRHGSASTGCSSTKIEAGQSSGLAPSLNSSLAKTNGSMNAPKINFPAANSPQRAQSSSSLVRSKIPLKPGRSLMDWIRLGKSGQDLAGTGGQIRKITMEELSKHDKETDAWILVRGKVYNITPYLEFHPGGIPEIMRGAGKDATDLFDEVHKWVNAESMLEKCYIGPIAVTSPSARNKRLDSLKSTGSSSSLQVPNSLAVSGSQVDGHKSSDEPTGKKSPDSVDGFKIPVPPLEFKPRYDWYQNGKMVTISVYTNKKDICVEDLIMQLRDDGKDFDAIINLGEKTYQFHFDLEDVVLQQQVRITSGTGKVDFLFSKENEANNWLSPGVALPGHGSMKKHKDRAVCFWDCVVSAVSDVSHNTKLLTLTLPKGVQMRVPIGHHVYVKQNIEGMEISRPYTVVVPALKVDSNEIEYEGRRIYLMIKIYNNGTLTPSLGNLKAGDTLPLGGYKGDFRVSRLNEVSDVALIAGGTGLTPMIRIIRKLVIDEPKSKVSVKLIFANNEERDICWKEQFDELVEASNNRFQVYYTVSKPSIEWDGYEGRINHEMLLEVLPSPPPDDHEKELLIGVCGPAPFTMDVKDMLSTLGYSGKSVHLFLG